MKKTIFKIAAVALFVGGLALNVGINKTSNNNMLTSLKTIAGISVAQAEATNSMACPTNGNGCLSENYWYPCLQESN